jgi:hypothetical protein
MANAKYLRVTAPGAANAYGLQSSKRYVVWEGENILEHSTTCWVTTVTFLANVTGF